MAYKSAQDQFAKQKADKEAADKAYQQAQSRYQYDAGLGDNVLNKYNQSKDSSSKAYYLDQFNKAQSTASKSGSEAGRLKAASSAMAGYDPTKDPEAAGQRLFGLSENRLQEQYDDPVSKMLFEQLTGRINGTDQPYNAQTINALTTKNNEATAAGEMNRAQQMQESLAARGFSPSDPAYQAAMRQNQTARQQQNQGALLDINSKANLANYDAKTGAMSQAGSLNAEQQSRLNQTTAGLANLYGQVHQGGTNMAPTGGGGVSMPDYSAFMQALAGQGGGQRTQQTTASAPAQAASQPASQPGKAYVPPGAAKPSPVQSGPTQNGLPAVGSFNPLGVGGSGTSAPFYQIPAKQGSAYVPPGAAKPAAQNTGVDFFSAIGKKPATINFR